MNLIFIFHIYFSENIKHLSQTLRSWLHETSAPIMTLSPGLEKNYTLEWSSNSFPGTTCLSGPLENCQKSIPKSWCSPIQGTISKFLLNNGTDFPFVFTHFRTLSPRLENIGALECCSDSFPGTLKYLLFLENS